MRQLPPGLGIPDGKKTFEELTAELEPYREKLRELFEPVYGPPPPQLPPIRAINHTITLIDPDKRYKGLRPPKCAAGLYPLFAAKTERYQKAGWWEPAAGRDPMPMLILPKKSGGELGIRTVVDARPRNDNTILDSTPLPDVDHIRESVAQAKYVTVIDLKDAYEQMRVMPDSVKNTLFSTPLGTFVSHVLQQGDANGPSSFQRLIMYVLQERIGRGVHSFIDDMFLLSFLNDTPEDHMELCTWARNKLREELLFVSRTKTHFFALRIQCLGMYRDENGIHASFDKLENIRKWPRPASYLHVQQFLGLVEYLARFMPNLSAQTTPLSSMCANGLPFIWRGLHEKCFETIKALTCRDIALRPIDRDSTSPIWIVCDACPAGCGAYYGQGDNWRTMYPSGFMSKKFSNAQRSYYAYEHETLAVIEATKKWDDRLVGLPLLNIVTDHEALKTFMTKDHAGPRQIRWCEWLTRYRINFIHVPGHENRAADALSRIFENPNAHEAQFEDMASADVELDPDGDELPIGRLDEYRVQHVAAMTRAQNLREVEEPRVTESLEMRAATPAPPEPEPVRSPALQLTLRESARAQSYEPFVWKPEIGAEHSPDLEALCKPAYAADTFFNKIVEDPKANTSFTLEDGLIHYNRTNAPRVLCIPDTTFEQRKLIELIITQAHRIVGHFGHRITDFYLRRFFWWPTMGKDVKTFCRSCDTCQAVKHSTQRTQGRLHTLPIPRLPWESISMDFVGPFPEVNGLDYIWVVLCRLTSTVHLIPTRTTITAAELAPLFMDNIVRLHGLPETIVSDRDPKFTSLFWTELHRLLGVKLSKTTAFHPQANGQAERTMIKIETILRSVVQPDQRNWPSKLAMCEFALNSSTSTSTGFAPFDLQGYTPTIMRSVDTSQYQGVQEVADSALNNVLLAHDALIKSRVEHTTQANRHRREDDPLLQTGNRAYLSTENLNLPKLRARKLTPRFIGPYKILDCDRSLSKYTLDLPEELRKRRIHPTFHANVLRPAVPNDDAKFPNREATFFYDFGDDPEREWLVSEIVDHKFEKNSIEFKVLWDTGETTDEPLQVCKDLAALDRYLKLHNVEKWRQLPRRKS